MKRKAKPDGLRLFQVFRYDDGSHEALLEDEPVSSEGMEFIGETRAKNFLDACLRVAGKLPEIDEAIRPLVLLLNELGFWTESCCSGHPDPSKPDEDDDGYVSFYFEKAGQQAQLRQLLRAIWQSEGEWHCVCEPEECDRDDHVPPRQLRDGTQLPSGELFLNLDLPPPLATYGGEWGVSIRFGCIGRAVLPIDYTWLVEQIELHTGRAKPLPVSAAPAVMGPLPTAREWAAAFDVGVGKRRTTLRNWGRR